ncbi:Zinc finger CCHC domain-containing protein 7, partial [Mesitornis unicolor]
EDSYKYEDELYHEESSSEQSVDSDVEFHLYSQIHYSQNLGEISVLEVDEESDDAGVPAEKKKITVDPEVIVLSDTPDEDSIYKSKAKKSAGRLERGKMHIHPASSTPNHAKAAACSALSLSGSGADTSREGRSAGGKLSPVCAAGAHTIADMLVIDDSSEESVISEDHVENWMLLGADADDGDEDIILNIEG